MLISEVGSVSNVHEQRHPRGTQPGVPLNPTATKCSNAILQYRCTRKPCSAKSIAIGFLQDLANQPKWLYRGTFVSVYVFCNPSCKKKAR